MISGISGAVSALNAYGKKLHVSANNTANVDSDGFKKDRVVIAEGDNGTVQARTEKVDTPGPMVNEATDQGSILVEKSNVDLAQEVTNQVLARRGYEANLATLRTFDEMLGSVLDIVK